MRPTDTALSHARARRGFNLVEAAIVLGVVGLVIGGIWTAASAVSENHKINETAKNLVLIVKRTQAIHDWRTAQLSGNVNLTETLFKAGIIPPDWNWSTPDRFRNPLRTAAASGRVVSYPWNLIVAFYGPIPSSTCIKFASALTQIESNDITTIDAYPYSGTGAIRTISTLPITMDNINYLCDGGASDFRIWFKHG
jgi:competence protein ComGC